MSAKTKEQGIKLNQSSVRIILIARVSLVSKAIDNMNGSAIVIPLYLCSLDPLAASFWFQYSITSSSSFFFTITAEILARSLVNFYCQ